MMSLRGGAWSSPNCLGSLFKRLSNEPSGVVDCEAHSSLTVSVRHTGALGVYCLFNLVSV